MTKGGKRAGQRKWRLVCSGVGSDGQDSPSQRCIALKVDKGIFLLHCEESGTFVEAWSRIPVGRYQGRNIVREEVFCNKRGMCGSWCSEGV